MACPFCEGPETLTGKTRIHLIDYPRAYIDFECTCDNCGKTFWQRQRFETDDFKYENMEDVGKETDLHCPHCYGKLCVNNYYDPKAEEGVESYPYVCPDCDENFYSIEAIKNVRDII